MNDLFAIANTKTSLGAEIGELGPPYPASGEKWLAAYNRIRGDGTITALMNLKSSCVSGPWPLTPVQLTCRQPVGSIEFYFEYTGSGDDSVNIFFGGVNEIVSQDPNWVHNVSTSLVIQLRVGGSIPIIFKGRFFFDTDSSPGTASCTSTFGGGVSFGINTTDYPGTFVSDYMEVTVDPGTYDFYISLGSPTLSNGYLQACGSSWPYGPALISTVPNSTAVDAAGIDKTYPIKKIVGDVGDGLLGIGIYSWVIYAYPATPPPTPIYQWKNGLLYDGGGFGIYAQWNATKAGLWLGKTEPVNSLGLMLQSYMPWNMLYNTVDFSDPNANAPTFPMPPLPLNNPHKTTLTGSGSPPSQTFAAGSYSNAYGNWELELCPPRWKKNVWYPAGFQVQDSNGNIQILTGTVSCLSNNDTEPTWGVVTGAVTTEGGYTVNGVNTAPCAWKLEKIISPSIKPAVARQFSIPKYPCCRDSAPVSLPVKFNPVAWWIYEVRLNRLGLVDSDGIAQPQSGTVAVTLGCIRNGSFVSFGTWNTGQAIFPMWPIFTSSPLVYQCTEVVDVQAVAISCGLGYATGGSVTWPVCATFYNDLEALLALIV